MTTIHFVYPHGSSISAPDSIGRNVAERLGHHHEVVQYDWNDNRLLRPGADDMLLGHPHPAPWTVFRRSARQKGWKRIIGMFPFTSVARYVAFADNVVGRCDVVLAITGNFWLKDLGASRLSHWAPKMIHVDMAVDREDFPVVKEAFSPPGSRRFVYIGDSSPAKNIDYLGELASHLPRGMVSWIGPGSHRVRNVRRLGEQDFATPEARLLVADHDFLLTVGKADANPATILESMAWGLVPVCTPSSGYVEYPSIVNIPLGDPERALAALERLQVVEETHLQEIQRSNWHLLDERFNWDRFSDQVLAAIEGSDSPALTEGLGRKISLRARAIASPTSAWHVQNLRTLPPARYLKAIRRAMSRRRS
jgi:glycosyltransferase involved in cell wall biosynthesis